MKSVFIIFFILNALIATVQAKPKIIPLEQKKYRIEENELKETSGLFYSRLNPNIIWTHNDSGNDPVLFALDRKGILQRQFDVKTKQNFDWEDISGFKLGAQSYLLIADTGDNFTIRNRAALLLIKEPIINGEPNTSVSPDKIIYFRYPGNKALNVEAVSVSTKLNKIFLITKSKDDSELYSLPLRKLVTRQQLEDLPTADFESKLPKVIKATASDMSSDDKWLAILSYGRIQMFDLGRPASLTKHAEQTFSFKGMFQPEGFCFGKNEQEVFISTEKKYKLLKGKLPK